MIVGRDAELAMIRAVVGDAKQQLVGLWIQGPAGIGKSTLWHAAIDAWREAGFRVGRARPSEADGHLSFSTLNDLLGPLLDDFSPRLPTPQRLALEVALMRTPSSSERPAPPLAISLGALGLIRAAAVDQPTLIAIDDAQWVDPASSSVLEFVVRRLDTEQVSILLASRTGGPVTAGSIVAGALLPDRREALDVGPLPQRDIGRLLASSLALVAPPSTVARIHRLAGGNPLHAFEIGRAMQRRGLTELEGRHDVPPSLSGLLQDRLAGLTAAGSRVVESASALSDPRRSTIEAVLGATETARGVENAVDAHVLEAADDVLRFTHPLLASEAYERMSENDRRKLHARLAGAATEVEQRATHLDLSSSDPDEDVAAALDAAAERADERGAPEAAAGFAERAARRTAVGGVLLATRRLATGRYLHRAGDMRRARAWLESALAEAPPGALRASILIDLGQVRLDGDDWEAARQLFEEALVEAGADARLRIEALLRRAGISFVHIEDRERGASLIEEAMSLAEIVGDPAVLARVIGPYAQWRWALRRPGLDALERRAKALEEVADRHLAREHFEVDFGHVNASRGRHARARELFSRQLARAEARGDYSSIPGLLAGMTRADFYAGRSAEALERLVEAERLARVTGQETPLSGALTEILIVNARVGRADAAWRAADELAALMSRLDRTRVRRRELEELATLELSRRRYGAALDILVPGAEDGRDAGVLDTTLPTRAEALIGLGRLDQAADALERYARVSGGRPVFGHDSADVDAGAGRVGAQLAAARGDLDRATGLIERALAAYSEDKDDWSRARALLVAADIHRRARRRALALAAAQESLALFQYFGASMWADRARELVGRIGGSDERNPGGLTPTQAEVVQLAIRGLTNRQIGDRLFMSRHTVDAHLRASFRALGVHSRRQLAAAMRDSHAAMRDSELGGPLET